MSVLDKIRAAGKTIEDRSKGGVLGKLREAGFMDKLPPEAHPKMTQWDRERYAQDRIGKAVFAVADDVVIVSTEGGETPMRDFEVMCVDNLGMEDVFDEDVTYVAVGSKSGLLMVHDRFGEVRQCLTERFRKVD